MTKWLRRVLGLALFMGLCALGYARAHVSAPPAGAGNPLLSLHHISDEAPLRGHVEQRLRAGSYTYLALRTDEKALQWAVVLGAGPFVGRRVSLRSMGRKREFHSRRLGRTFPDLVFGIVSRVD